MSTAWRQSLKVVILCRESRQDRWVLKNKCEGKSTWAYFSWISELYLLFLEQALPIDVSFDVLHTRDSRGYSIPITNRRHNSMEVITVSANQPNLNLAQDSYTVWLLLVVVVVEGFFMWYCDPRSKPECPWLCFYFNLKSASLLNMPARNESILPLLWRYLIYLNFTQFPYLKRKQKSRKAIQIYWWFRNT